MAIAASSVTPTNSLEEFRIEFNNLVSDVTGITSSNKFTENIIFEGATADAYETTLTVTDPTADRTVTLPNATGTVQVSGNVITGTTIEPTGDTSTGDSAALGYTSVLGAILTGQGSTNDVTLVNDADATVLGIPTGTTNVDIVGVATAATFEPDGDTSTGDNAAIGYTSGEGLILTGQGSTNDVTIKNDADGAVISIPTGTTNVTIAGDLTISGDDLVMGTNTDTAILVADGTNYNPVVPSGDVSLTNAGVFGIASGVIVNADVNASAAIADSKLATISTANKVALTALDLDGGTEIGAAIVDADLFIIDDGAGGTNKKVLASRLKTYAAGTTLDGIDDQTSSNDDQLTITDSAVIINEDSDDLDFRVESNGNANMLFVDGGNDRVGIGTASPGGIFHSYTTSNDGLFQHEATGGNAFLDIVGNRTSDADIGHLRFQNADTAVLAQIRVERSGANNTGLMKLQVNNAGSITDIATLSTTKLTIPILNLGDDDLDTYDEGSWTPVLNAASGSGTIVYTTQDGTYTRIGNQVFLRFELYTSDIAERTGVVEGITGLPFTSKSAPSLMSGGGAASHWGNFSTAASGEGIYLWVEDGTANMKVYVNDSNTTLSELAMSEWTDSGRLWGSIVYEV